MLSRVRPVCAAHVTAGLYGNTRTQVQISLSDSWPRRVAMAFPNSISPIRFPYSILSSSHTCRYPGSALCSGARFRYSWPVANIDQSRRAIRFANATATTILGGVSSIWASQGSTQRFRRSIELITDIAPMMSNRRTSFWPIFVTRPSRYLPPVECCLRTRLSQAAKSRPLRKFFAGGQKAATSIADMGPTPGKRLPCRDLPSDNLLFPNRRRASG